jgi:hypothetical protein
MTVGTVGIALFLAVAVLHSGAYFFLFDDYAVVAAAGHGTIGGLIREPLIGFYRCTEGPHMLKSYAFRYFFGSRVPPVRSDIVEVSCADPLAVPEPVGRDAFSEYTAVEGERHLRLSLERR